jgi:8-oxo-dGTP pyrophosphatase MutT (NUDIX family)
MSLATICFMEKIPDTPGRRGAVAIVVQDGRLLVIRRSRHVIAPLTYCFPGGGIEAGETEETAVVREVREEIGLPIRPVRRLWECVTAWKVHLAWWLADMDPGVVAVPNPREVESIHWFTPREMASLPELLDSNREFLDLIEKGEIRLTEL